MTEGYVYVITYRDSSTSTEYIRRRDQENQFIERKTDYIERAYKFMTREEAKITLLAVSDGWWDRLLHWRIKKVPVSIFE